MIQAWQKRLLDTKVIFVREFRDGTHTFTLPSNKYRMTLIGCGGQSQGKTKVVTARPTVLYEQFMAQGGVGGTLIVEFNVINNPEITVHVGDNNSPDTYITGILNYALRAGGGTNAAVTSSSSGVAGSMGTNIAEGEFFTKISNPNIIQSQTLYTPKIANPTYNFLNLLNSNYPKDTTLGMADSEIKRTGYVLIEAV